MNLNIRVIPNARQNKITVEPDGNLKIHTTTAPSDGKANEAVIKQLSKYLGVPKSRIKIIRGETFRDKIVFVQD